MHGPHDAAATPVKEKHHDDRFPPRSPGPVAALCTAALAVPVSTAGAMTIDECVNARVATANEFFQNAFAPNISQADYWFWMRSGIYAGLREVLRRGAVRAGGAKDGAPGRQR
jgi:hypothetical protein